MIIKNKILVISYTFPPSESVGGKRWFNIAKELANTNDVDIISSSPNTNFEIFRNIFYLKSKYPSILNDNPSRLTDIIKYRIAMLKLKWLVNGSIFDKGKRDVKSLKKLVIKCQKINKYDIVITTGAPFSYLSNIVDLKSNELFKETLFYCDIRDPWTWGSGYGMKTLSKRRRKFELHCEKNVVKNSDRLFVPSQVMKEYLDNFYLDNKTEHLPHGFDKLKIDNLKLRKPSNKVGVLSLIYGGTWYQNIDDQFSLLIKSFEKSNSEINYNIYTNSVNINEKNKVYNSYKSSITFNNYIRESELFREINDSDAFVLIFPDDKKDFLSAKLFEICYIGTPIIFIGKEGVVSEFLKTNQFGIHILPDRIDMILEIFDSEILELQPNQAIRENFSFESIASRIIN